MLGKLATMVPWSALGVVGLFVAGLYPQHVLGQSDATPTSPGGSQGLEISTDGTCGDGLTCLGSTWGRCCSEHGFCGSSDSYCGSGCQAIFGTCGGVANQGPSIGQSCPSPSNSVTKTLTATAVDVLTKTQTVTAVVTSTATATTTRVRWTSSITTIHEISTRTQTIKVTSTTLIVEHSTTITTATVLSTILTTASTCSCVTTPPPPPPGPPPRPPPPPPPPSPSQPTRTTTAVGPTATEARSPAPTLPGTARDCKEYYLTKEGDTCKNIAKQYGIEQSQLRSWNPSLGYRDSVDYYCDNQGLPRVLSGLCKVDCRDLWPGYNLCVRA